MSSTSPWSTPGRRRDAPHRALDAAVAARHALHCSASPNRSSCDTPAPPSSSPASTWAGRATAARFLHAHGEIGADIRRHAPFYKYLLREAIAGRRERPESYSLAADAARPRPLRAARWVSRQVAHVELHVRFSSRRGCLRRVPARARAAARRAARRRRRSPTSMLGEPARIRSAALADGSGLPARLFLDCFGPGAACADRRRATTGRPGCPAIACGPRSRPATGESAAVDAAPSPARRAGSGARRWPRATTVGYVYCSRFVDDDAARERCAAVAPAVTPMPASHALRGRPAPQVLGTQLRGPRRRGRRARAARGRGPASRADSASQPSSSCFRSTGDSAVEGGRVQPPHGRTRRRVARLHDGALPRRARRESGEFWRRPASRRCRDASRRTNSICTAPAAASTCCDHETFEEVDWAWLLLGAGLHAYALSRCRSDFAARNGDRRSRWSRCARTSSGSPARCRATSSIVRRQVRAGDAEPPEGHRDAAKRQKNRDRRRRHRRLDDGGRIRPAVDGRRLLDRAGRVRGDRHRRRGRGHHPADRRLQPLDAGSTRTSSCAPRRRASSSASSSSTGRASGIRTSIPSAATACRCRASTSTTSGCGTTRRAERSPPDAFCSNIVAARAGRFARPLPDDRSPLPPLAYAYHFDAGLYAAFLRKLAEARRREAHRGQGRRTCSSTARDGFIESVTLAGWPRHRRRPVHRLLRISRPADRADAARRLRGLERLAALRSRDGRALRAHRRHHAVHTLHRARSGLAVAHPAAAPHRQRLRLLQPVHERRRGREPAADAARRQGARARRARCVSSRAAARKSGRRTCVALGLASGFLEPLESTSIHLDPVVDRAPAVHVSRRRLRPGDHRQIQRAGARRELEEIRDFLVLHYTATEREDTPFWRHCRAITKPDIAQADAGRCTSAAATSSSRPASCSGSRAGSRSCTGQGLMPRSLSSRSRTFPPTPSSQRRFELMSGDVQKRVADFSAARRVHPHELRGAADADEKPM